MHGFLASVGYSFRLLLKSPGFTTTAILILGFGIGANTAIFSLIDTVLLRSLPYPQPDRLITVTLASSPTNPANDAPFDYPYFLDYCRAQHSFASLALEVLDSIALSVDGRTEQVRVAFD